jgi:hypothetical protein
MKASQFLVTAALFTGLATLGIAGPGAQYWTKSQPVATTQDAAAVQPGDTLMMVCGACKSVTLTEFKSINPNGRPPHRWVEIGMKHECDHCGGAITTVNGKTTDSMQHNCSMCGEGAAFCCKVTPATATKKT